MSVGVVLFDDAASAPSSVVPVLDAGALPSNLDPGALRGSLEVVDASMNDYVFVLLYATGTSTYALAGAHARGAPATLAMIEPNAAASDLSPDCIAYGTEETTNAYSGLFSAKPTMPNMAATPT